MGIHYGRQTQPAICGQQPSPRERGSKVADLAERNVRAWHLVDCTGCLAHRPAPIETDRMVAAMQRMIRALEERCIDDPAALPQVILLAQQLSDITNVTIARCMAKRAAVSRTEAQYAAPSGNELATLLFMTPQSVTDRRKLGDRLLVERAMGQTTISQGERQRRSAAAAHAETALADFRARLASLDA